MLRWVRSDPAQWQAKQARLAELSHVPCGLRGGIEARTLPTQTAAMAHHMLAHSDLTGVSLNMSRPGTITRRSDPILDFHKANRMERQPREQTKPEWRFMDTAPRDGTPILAWVRWQNASPSPAIVAYEVREWVRVGMRRTVGEQALTHWMPLPGEPEEYSA